MNQVSTKPCHAWPIHVRNTLDTAVMVNYARPSLKPSCIARECSVWFRKQGFHSSKFCTCCVLATSARYRIWQTQLTGKTLACETVQRKKHCDSSFRFAEQHLCSYLCTVIPPEAHVFIQFQRIVSNIIHTSRKTLMEDREQNRVLSKCMCCAGPAVAPSIEFKHLHQTC